MKIQSFFLIWTLFFITCTPVKFSNNNNTTSNSTASSNDFSVTPTTLNFSQVPINTNVTQDITLKNISSSSAFSIQPIDNLPASITANTSSCATVSAQTSCTIPITYSPVTDTSVSTSFNISGIDTSSHTSVTHPFSLTANTASVPAVAAADFSISPSTLTFNLIPLNTSSTQTITLQNLSSTATFTIQPIRSLPSTISMNISNCLLLTPNASCTATVTYTPTLSTPLSMPVSIAGISSLDQSTVSHTFTLTATGIALSSTIDIPYLVGWYVYTPQTIVSIPPSHPTGFLNCRSKANIAADNLHGNPSLYCYEPSGSNGMTLTSDQDTFNNLVTYILNNSKNQSTLNIPGQPCTNGCATPTIPLCGGGVTSLSCPDKTQFCSILSFESLFNPNPQNSILTQRDWSQAVFYYMLAYLIIPDNMNSALLNNLNTDFQYSATTIDDGLELIINGQIAGNHCLFSQGYGAGYPLTPFSFLRIAKNISQPLSSTSKTSPSIFFPTAGNCAAPQQPPTPFPAPTVSTPTLNTGINTIVALWVDDFPCNRALTGSSFQYTLTKNNFEPIHILSPNVVQGYIYSALNGSPIAGSIQMTNSLENFSQTCPLDSTGFFQCTALPNGATTLTVFSPSQQSLYSESLTLNASVSNQSAVIFTKGI